MLLGSENEATQEAGLHKGDVIVALNGIRIHNKDQYLFAWVMSNEPELDLIIWQKNHYREIKASPPDRSFGANFTDYSPSLAAR